MQIDVLSAKRSVLVAPMIAFFLNRAQGTALSVFTVMTMAFTALALASPLQADPGEAIPLWDGTAPGETGDVEP